MPVNVIAEGEEKHPLVINRMLIRTLQFAKHFTYNKTTMKKHDVYLRLSTELNILFFPFYSWGVFRSTVAAGPWNA